MEYAFSGGFIRRRSALAGVALVLGLSSGCAEPSSSPKAEPGTTSTLAGAGLLSARGANASVEQQLAQLRAVIAPYHNFETASQAGYGNQITGCMELQPLGGMGFHYGKLSAIVDGIANPQDPDVLLYEPQKNGKLRLVGVEFVIRYSELPRSSEAPEAFGQKFVHNDDFQLWALHVWVATNNPSGIFKDWNPSVNCDEAPPVENISPMSH